MKNYTAEDFLRKVGRTSYNDYILCQQILSTLANADENGLTPKELTRKINATYYSNSPFGAWSLQKIVGIIKWKLPDFIQRVVVPTDKTIEVKRQYQVFVPVKDNLYELHPVGEKIIVPVEKVIYKLYE